MAKETETSETKPAQPTLDWAAAESKINDIENHLNTFAGRPGFNPFKYHAEKVAPLKRRLSVTAERNITLWNEIAALKKEDPKVDVKPSDKPVEIKVEPTNTAKPDHVS